MLGWVLDKNKVSLNENRRYASFPHLKLSPQSIVAFPAAFDSFLNDRFPYRFQLTAFSNLLKWKLFGSSGNDDVLIGKDGWLFFLQAGNRDFLRHESLTDEKLRIFVSTFENRRRWLAMHHIRYLLVFVPCKCEMYREEIPSQYRTLNPDTMQEQLVAALKKYTWVDVIYLKKDLLGEKAKFEFPLYLVTDTHWNQLGAFVACQVIARHLQEMYPAIKPLRWQDVNLSGRREAGGDLARMLGVGNYASEETTMVKIRNQHWEYSSHPPVPNLNSETGHYLPFATDVNNPSLPKAYFVRDSFTIYLQPFLSENFKRAYFYWNYRRTKENDFLAQEILNEHPDIVIQEMAENVLALDAFPNPPEVENALSDRFQFHDNSANLKNQKASIGTSLTSAEK